MFVVAKCYCCLKKKTDRFRLINYQPGYCEKEVRKSVWEHLKRSSVSVARKADEMKLDEALYEGEKSSLFLCVSFSSPHFFGLLLCANTVTTLATSVSVGFFSHTHSSL